MNNQLTTFNARLDRIKDPKNLAWTDPETGINIPRRLSRKAINETQRAVKKITLFTMIVSFALGGLCLMVGRFVRFRIADMNPSSYSQDVLLVTDLAIGFVFAVVLGTMIGHAKAKLQATQVVGILLMAVSMHNLVWAFPERAELVYGPEFVAQVLAETAPRSIYLRGQVITL